MKCFSSFPITTYCSARLLESTAAALGYTVDKFIKGPKANLKQKNLGVTNGATQWNTSIPALI